MQLAYVINSLEAGGAQYPIPRIVAELRKHGIDTTVYALSERDDLAVPALEAAGVRMVRAPLTKTQHVAGYRWLKAVLQRDTPDVIWTSLTQATLIGQRVGQRLKTPVISWQHNAFLKDANRKLLRFQRGLSRFWVADSEAVARFTKTTLDVAAEDIEILPLFVAPNDAPQASAYEGGTFEWLSVGRLHPNKGFGALIEAFAEIAQSHDVHLRIIGEGRERAKLEDLITRHGLQERVTLLGHISDVPAQLASAHGYVQPSLNEGLGIAAHEAMAAGLPCLVSNTGQMALTVTPLHVFQARDRGGLQRAIENAMNDLDGFRATGAMNRERVLERFSADRFEASIATIAQRLRDVITPA